MATPVDLEVGAQKVHSYAPLPESPLGPHATMRPLVFRKTMPKIGDASEVWHNTEFDNQIRQCFGALLAGPAVANGLSSADVIAVTWSSGRAKVTSEMLRCWAEELNLHLGAPDNLFDDMIKAANELVRDEVDLIQPAEKLVDEKDDGLSFDAFKNFVLAAITYGCPLDELRQTFNEMDPNQVADT